MLAIEANIDVMVDATDVLMRTATRTRHIRDVQQPIHSPIKVRHTTASSTQSTLVPTTFREISPLPATQLISPPLAHVQPKGLGSHMTLKKMSPKKRKHRLSSLNTAREEADVWLHKGADVTSSSTAQVITALSPQTTTRPLTPQARSPTLASLAKMKSIRDICSLTLDVGSLTIATTR